MPDFTSSTIARLSCLMDEVQLQDFIRVCKSTRENGNGYGTVEVTFSRHSLTAFRGHFEVKSPDAGHRLKQEY